MLRGRGRSILTSSSTRPGAALITTTRSASSTASSIWWVTNRIVDLKPGPDLEQELLHQHARLEVERGERLVHQDELRAADQRARDRHALLHAAGELVRVVLGELDELHALQHLAAAAPALVLAHASSSSGRRRRCCSTFSHGNSECSWNTITAFGFGPGHLLAVDQDLAARHRLQARAQLEQRALAAAARAEDGDELARGHLQADLADRLHRQPARALPDLSSRCGSAASSFGRPSTREFFL